MNGVLITGGTGLLGHKIAEILRNKGFRVHFLGRKATKQGKFPVFEWHYEQEKIDSIAFENIQHIIHLAGANVGEGKWTVKRKTEILESRVHSANFLFDYIKKNKIKVDSFISASAIGFYGDTSNYLNIETNKKGEGFLADVCDEWEKSANNFEQLGTRVVKIRTGVVLSKDGGALPKIVLSLKGNVGTVLGSGNQYYSWIHLNDIANIFVAAISNPQMKGTYNGVAPNPINFSAIIDSAAKAMDKKNIRIKIPAFALKLAMGEQSAIVLDSCKASAQKIINTGFQFQFANIDEAMRDLVGGNT
jgi:hypothetical protein